MSVVRPLTEALKSEIFDVMDWHAQISEVVQANNAIQDWVAQYGGYLPPEFHQLLVNLDWLIRGSQSERNSNG